MSVTFWMPKAPYEWITPFKDEPDYKESVPCEGFLELNHSNTNARALLLALERITPVPQENDLCGVIMPEDFVKHKNRICKLLSGEGWQEMLQKDEREGNIYYFGRDEHKVKQMLRNMLALLRCADEQNPKLEIHYA